MSKNTIKYPYLPKGRKIHYVSESNRFMQIAKKFAKNNSLDENMPTGSAIVYEDKVIGLGANGSDYHQKYGCERVKNNIPTGQGYELCEGCHPKNHSEPKAIKKAQDSHPEADLTRADLYLWGHWWACEPCWNSITEAGIKDVYLTADSHKFFNKTHPENIVGKQFN
nr:Cytidine and deoxycytidylate deaminase zinc-binding region [uncultured bacterium]AIA13350.1 Cytidine and deoxycytidylate deaminase zinc-binding region [uncultured bacterium]